MAQGNYVYSATQLVFPIRKDSNRVSTNFIGKVSSAAIYYDLSFPQLTAGEYKRRGGIAFPWAKDAVHCNNIKIEISHGRTLRMRKLDFLFITLLLASKNRVGV